MQTLTPSIWGRIATGESWAAKKTLVEFAREEIESYQAELAFLDQALAGLRCDYRLEWSQTQGSISNYERTRKCGRPAGDWVLETGLKNEMTGQTTTLEVAVGFRLDEATLAGEYSLTSRYNHFSSQLGCDVRTCELKGACTAKLVTEHDEPKLVFVPSGPARQTCRNSIPCGNTRVEVLPAPQPLAPVYELEEGSFCG